MQANADQRNPTTWKTQIIVVRTTNAIGKRNGIDEIHRIKWDQNVTPINDPPPSSLKIRKSLRHVSTNVCNNTTNKRNQERGIEKIQT